jgi:hypothetical protein
MIARVSIFLGLTVVIGYLALGALRAASPEAGDLPMRVRARIVSRTPRFRQRAGRLTQPIVSGPASTPPRPSGSLDFTTEQLVGGDMLPLWKYALRSPRDGHSYSGTVLGLSPFDKPGTARIRTQIVPLIFRTHRIGTSIDPGTFDITTTAGETTVDPTGADNTCMTAPNNVPLTVVRQSPIFTPTRFVVGGTDVGTTQYVDASLRSSFWNALGSKAQDYHTLLDPIHVMNPIVIDVPPNEGVAITDPKFFAALGFSVCGPLQMIDWYWFDSYLRGTILPGLPDVDPASLPIFLSYNAAWAYGVDNLFNCCQPAWSSSAGYPVATQTFVVGMFDRTNLFTGPDTGFDIGILSEAISNWATDPYFEGNSPPWGNTPGWAGCIAVALSGSALDEVSLPPVPTANGFPYHVPESTFLQYFYGGPSTGVNGWFSMGGTFRSDAGSLCP